MSVSLNRFIDAQDEYSFSKILEELRYGEKIGHWMWFVFPQLKGLGTSSKSQFYGITSLVEAKGYWGHPVLGVRLRESLRDILISKRTVAQIFGKIDTLKLHSCVTLFIYVAKDDHILNQVLTTSFNDELDYRTLELVKTL